MSTQTQTASNEAETTNVAAINSKPSKKVSLVAKMAEKFGVDPTKLWDTLKATAFKQRNGNPPTNEQMMALLIVADQYGLNPFTKEIYAFPDQQNGIVPVVGVDGWSRIINTNLQFDGMEFRVAETTIELDGLNKPVFEWIECVMYRKDRERPTIIREYMDEIYREPFKKNGSNGPYVIKGPWQTHPRRFARHKVLIQTARIALGYTGIYDQDEAERILDGEATEVSQQPSITFDVEPQQAIAAPTAQPEIMQDLSQADFMEMETETVTVQSEQAQPQTHKQPPKSQFVQTEFGDVRARDVNMIGQMIQFTSDNGSWDTTKDSFEERYNGKTLEYALSELKLAFNRAFSE